MKYETRKLTIQLSPVEIDARKTLLPQLLDELAEIEAEKASAAAKYSKAIKDQKERIKKTAIAARTGEEVRELRVRLMPQKDGTVELYDEHGVKVGDEPAPKQTEIPGT